MTELSSLSDSLVLNCACTTGFPGKRLLNGRVCVCVCVCVRRHENFISRLGAVMASDAVANAEGASRVPRAKVSRL